MLRGVVLTWTLAGGLAAAESPAFTLQGRITLDKPASEVVLIVQDPAAKNAEVAKVEVSPDGEYLIPGLSRRSYRLTAVVDGKRQERRDVELLCRPGAIVSKDFHYGNIPSTLMLGFPSEDPDFVDVAELRGDYPREILREYERSFQDLINGNSERAIERLEAIAIKAPTFYGAHARLGVIYQQEGCFFDAESEYARASALSPRSPQPLINLASVQLRAADLPGERERMTEKAISTLAKAIELRPSSAIAYCLLGSANLKVDRIDEAEANFKRAAELDQAFGAPRLMLANLYLRQENWQNAVEILDRYLDDFPLASDRAIVRRMLDEAKSRLRSTQQ